jgi:hypothetical protein
MMIYESYYTTPRLVGLQLEKANPGFAPSEALSEYDDYYANVTLYCRQASAYISQQTNRVFVPYRHTYTVNLERALLRRAIAYSELALPDDLLVETAVHYEDVLLDPTSYELVSALLYDTPPYYAVRLNAQLWGLGSLSVTGWWGFGRGLSRAFETVEVITGTLNASATTLSVADGARYDVYQTLKLDDELVLVLEVVGDELTIARGQRGTTASSHTNFTIRRAVVEDGIALVATRLAANLYQRRNDAAGRIQFADGSTVINEMPPAVRETIAHYRRLNSMSV